MPRRNQMKAGVFPFLWPGVFRFRFVSLPQIVGKFVEKKLGHRHSAIVERIADDDSVRHHLFHISIIVNVSRDGLNLIGRHHPRRWTWRSGCSGCRGWLGLCRGHYRLSRGWRCSCRSDNGRGFRNRNRGGHRRCYSRSNSNTSFSSRSGDSGRLSNWSNGGWRFICGSFRNRSFNCRSGGSRGFIWGSSGGSSFSRQSRGGYRSRFGRSNSWSLVCGNFSNRSLSLK